MRIEGIWNRKINNKITYWYKKAKTRILWTFLNKQNTTKYEQFSRIPGVIIVPRTTGSKNSETIVWSGKWAGFEINISSLPNFLIFFAPVIQAEIYKERIL